LVLLMGWIYKARRLDGLRCHDIHIKFQDDRFRRSSNIETITSTMSEVSVLVLLMGRIYDVRI
jgi:hypothetical protein